MKTWKKYKQREKQIRKRQKTKGKTHVTVEVKYT